MGDLERRDLTVLAVRAHVEHEATLDEVRSDVAPGVQQLAGGAGLPDPTHLLDGGEGQDVLHRQGGRQEVLPVEDDDPGAAGQQLFGR